MSDTDSRGDIQGMQRREAFRVRAPAVRPLMAMIELFDRRRHTLRVLDLSVLGAGLLFDPTELTLDSGLTVPGFSLDLGAFGVIECALEIRHVRAAGASHPAGCLRAGAAFIRLPVGDSLRLTRYVYAAERKGPSLR